MSSYSNPYGYAYATSGSVPYGLGDPYPSPTANYDSRVMTRDYSHARSGSSSSSGSAAAPQQKQLKAR